jgi:hypothetical protein
MKQTIECPICLYNAWLIEEYINIYSASLRKSVNVLGLCYLCDKCGGSFTNTESDTITMKRYDIVVRNEKRKIKIIKLFEVL